MDKFTCDISARWGDMDALGHINHAKYFTYFEQARITWWNEHSISLSEDQGPVLVKAEAEYLQALSSPCEMIVLLWAHSAGRSSYWIEYELIQESKVCARGRTKVVWVDYKKSSSVPLPRKMLNAIKSFGCIHESLS